MNGDANILDPKIMIEFVSNLDTFNKAMKAANTEVDTLLNKPGIDSQALTVNLTNIKRKLSELSAKWDSIADDARKKLNISIEEAQKLQEKMISTTE